MRSLCTWLFVLASCVVMDFTVAAPADDSAAVTCSFNGTIYASGDHIPIPEDVCLHCECRPGWKGPSETECARIDCPYFMLGFHPPECPMENTPGKCCPDSPCLRKLEEEESSRLD